MSLKKRIEAFLEAREKTLDDLADYLEINIDELERGISDNSVEVRTLENISKALRIPLYSFFPGYVEQATKHEIPYYDRKLPNEGVPNDKTEIETLEEEIRFLSKYLETREKQLQDLRNA
jgi:transcriptional regulator with XRE-family HTH domain